MKSKVTRVCRSPIRRNRRTGRDYLRNVLSVRDSHGRLHEFSFEEFDFPEINKAGATMLLILVCRKRHAALARAGITAYLNEFWMAQDLVVRTHYERTSCRIEGTCHTSRFFLYYP